MKKKKINIFKKKKKLSKFDFFLENKIKEKYDGENKKSFYLNMIDFKNIGLDNKSTNNKLIKDEDDLNNVISEYEKKFFEKNKINFNYGLNIFKEDKYKDLENLRKKVSIDFKNNMDNIKKNYDNFFNKNFFISDIKSNNNDFGKTLKFFLKKTEVGFFYKYNFCFFFEKKFEIYLNYLIYKNLIFNKRKNFLIKNFIKSKIKFFFLKKKKFIFYLYFISFIFNYKSWRHYKSYPVSGQRTWSNGNNAFRCNIDLKKIKLKSFLKFNKIFLNKSRELVNVFFLAENINNFYKLQCYQEWTKGKKLNKRMLSKRNIFKIDINLLARGELQSFTSSKLRKRSKKKKLATIGFNLGFTKKLLKSYYSYSDDRKKLGNIKRYIKDINKKYKNKKNRYSLKNEIKSLKKEKNF